MLCMIAFHSSCANSHTIVNPGAGTVRSSILPTVETVVIVEPSIGIVELPGRDMAASPSDKAPIQALLTTAASAALRQRLGGLSIIPPASQSSSPQKGTLSIRRLADRSPDVTYTGQCDPTAIRDCRDSLGLGGNSAVLFTSVEVRLSYSREARVPLIVTGQPETHSTVLRTALFSGEPPVTTWANTVFVRTSPNPQNESFRQAVDLLFHPLRKETP
jgi:hypothetical protein